MGTDRTGEDPRRNPRGGPDVGFVVAPRHPGPNRFATVSFGYRPPRSQVVAGSRALIPGEYHVLAPTTRGATKRWPLSVGWRCGQAIGGPCVVVGSPADRPSLVALANALGSSGHLAAGDLSLGGTMGLVAGAARLVGLDSAPLHMASGFGVEALGLFGPTDPALTGPWRGAGASIRPTGVPPHVRYRHTDDRWMRQLSVGMVLDRLEEIPMTPPAVAWFRFPATPGHAATSGVYGHGPSSPLG